MTDGGFVYFDLPEPALVRRWLSLGFVVVLTLALMYLAAAG